MSDPDQIDVGDVVSVLYGSRVIDAEVLEDRGGLGPTGDRLLRVGWTPTGSDERLEFDVPASQVRPAGSTFESRVESILRRLPVQLETSRRSAGWAPDFVVRTPAGRLLVEAMSVRGAISSKAVDEARRRLASALVELDATAAVLVVPRWDRPLLRSDSRPGLSVVPVSELEDWLIDLIRDEAKPDSLEHAVS